MKWYGGFSAKSAGRILDSGFAKDGTPVGPSLRFWTWPSHTTGNLWAVDVRSTDLATGAPKDSEVAHGWADTEEEAQAQAVAEVRRVLGAWLAALDEA